MHCFKELGAGFDLVSGGELERALAIGAKPSSLVFAGVGKSATEIQLALTVGVNRLPSSNKLIELLANYLVEHQFLYALIQM